MARDILEELVTKFTFDVDKAGLNTYLRSQDKINRNTKTMIGLNSTLSKVMRGIFFGAGAILGVNSLVNTYRNFDMVQRSLNALTGSAEEGAEHFEFLKRAAMQTGTGVMEVAKAYRGYYYAAKTAGLSNEELQHSFLGVMVGARVLGANKQQVGGAMLALEQMLNKTTVQAQELNLQLGNAISGAKEMAAEAMGMSVSEFVEKMQKKMINSAEFVRKFGDYMYQTFINKLPEAMKSLDASIINLENAWLIFQHEIMKGGLGEELTKLTAQLMQVLLSPEAKNFAQAIGQGLNMVGKALSFIVKHWKTLLWLWGVSTFIQGINSLAMLRWKILDVATTLNGQLYPAMNSIVTALANMLFYGGGLKSVLKSLGSVALAVGKNFLWVTLIAGALYGIYLIIEDIFTYINHPDWDSFTKDLVTELPFIGEMIEAIKNTFKEMSPFITEIKQIWGKIGGDIIQFLKKGAPLLIWYLKLSIVHTLVLARIFSWILDLVIKISKFLGYGSDFAKDHPKLFYLTGGGANPLNTIASHVYKRKQDVKKPLDMNYLTDFGQAGYLGALSGGNYNKVVTDNKNVSNTIQIYAQNKTDAEIISLLSKAMSGELDTIENIVNPTSKYLKPTGAL